MFSHAVQPVPLDPNAFDAATDKMSRTERWYRRWIELFTQPEKVEGLEFVCAIGNLVMASVLWGVSGYAASVINLSFTSFWRVVFIALVGLAGLGSAFGYLDDYAKMRRGAAFVSYAGWTVWATSVWHSTAFALSPILHVLTLGAALVWTWIHTRIGTNEVKKRYPRCP